MCCRDVHHIGSLDPFTEWGTHGGVDHVEADSTKETTDGAIVDVEDVEGEADPRGSMITGLDGEEWAPANGPMNTWVQVGAIDGDGSTTCTMYHEVLGERPQWGVDGSMRDIKHHIMCCLM